MLYQKIAELDHNVTIDELTGVYNRYYIAHILPCKLMEAVYTEQRFGFAMLDIDDLKKVNDTWGHQAGDHFIRTIIKCVSENLNANDAVCRYGGDEFLIFMKVAKREEFKQKIGEMLSRIRTLKIKTVAMMPSVSIGGVFYGEIVPAEASLHTLENYIAKADQRLYQAKKARQWSVLNRNGVTSDQSDRLIFQEYSGDVLWSPCRFYRCIHQSHRD